MSVLEEAICTIMVKPTGNFFRDEFYRCRAQFVLDPDGIWRLRKFELFMPHVDPNQTQPIMAY